MKLGLKDLFKDLTWMQVGAGALAAATSLFFASSIGIAGSVIGAAVGSIVTTVSSALYKSFLTASNDAIKEKIGTPSRHADAFSPTASDSSRTPTCDEAAGHQGAQPSPYKHASGSGPRSSVRDPRETARVRELARLRKRARTEKAVVIVSLVTGLVAVLGCALIVYTATDGSGLGYRPAPALAPVQAPVINNAPASAENPDPQVPAGDESAETPDTPAGNPDSITVTTPAVPEPDAGSSDDLEGSNEGGGPAEPSNPGDLVEPEAPAVPQEPDAPDPGSDPNAQESTSSEGTP